MGESWSGKAIVHLNPTTMDIFYYIDLVIDDYIKRYRTGYVVTAHDLKTIFQRAQFLQEQEEKKVQDSRQIPT